MFNKLNMNVTFILTQNQAYRMSNSFKIILFSGWLVGCDLIDYHPYDGRLDSGLPKRINTAQIARIKAKTAKRWQVPTSRFAVLTYANERKATCCARVMAQVKKSRQPLVDLLQ